MSDDSLGELFDAESFAGLLRIETQQGASEHGLDVDSALELARVIERGRYNTDTDEETDRRLRAIVHSLENTATEEQR